MVAPEEEELVECNGIDDNCDGGVDNDGVDCGCNQGDTDPCEADGDVCTTGIQTCDQSSWGDCVETTVDNCDPNDETLCVPGFPETCGTNAGICVVGYKECQGDGTWGECQESVGPKNSEICANGLDDDCDEITDEPACVIVAPDPTDQRDMDPNTPGIQTEADVANQNKINNQNKDDSSSKGGNEAGIKWDPDAGFFSRLVRFFINLFYVGKSLAGYSISEIPTDISTCTEGDGGKNYFLMGAGTGISTTGNEAIFEDFCYKDSQSNKQERCVGDGCYLLEYYCEGEKIASDRKVICEFGCLDGACIPDSSLNKDCYYFDKTLWKWVNNC